MYVKLPACYIHNPICGSLVEVLGVQPLHILPQVLIEWKVIHEILSHSEHVPSKTV